MTKGTQKIFAALVTTALLSAIPSAQAAEVTVGTDVISSYVWRGITLTADPVVQPSVDIAHPSGFGLNVWGNFDLGDDDGVYEENQFSEIDISLSYTLDLDPLSITVGYIEYVYPGAFEVHEITGEIEHVKADREVFVGTSAELLPGLTLDVTAYYEFETVKDIYAIAELAYAMDLTDALSLSVYGSIGYAGKDAAAGGESGFHEYLVGVSTAFAVTENLELSAFVNYVDSVDSDVLPDEFIREDVFGGVSAYYSF
jgi:uncharacterized protein (TIGR02001 family)